MIMPNELKFEEAMNQLAEVVTKLESGEATLDESIDLFEKGMKLSKQCSEILQKAEQKVRFLQEEAEKENAES